MMSLQDGVLSVVVMKYVSCLLFTFIWYLYGYMFGFHHLCKFFLKFCFLYWKFLGDIIPPRGVSESMEMQAEAERKKRAAIIEAEG